MNGHVLLLLLVAGIKTVESFLTLSRSWVQSFSKFYQLDLKITPKI